MAPNGPQGPLDWDTEARPVLDAVYRAYGPEPSDMGVTQEAINAELGREPRDRRTDYVLRELEQTNWIVETMGTDQTMGPLYCKVSEKGLQLVAGWPTTTAEAAVEKLLALVDLRITEASDPEERSKWQRIRDGLLGVGREALVRILADAASAQV